MIYIRKQLEPRSLLEYRMKDNAYYDGCNKDDIRESLMEEQGYLCAYCMSRISDYHEAFIEHYIPQTGETGKNSSDLDYRNMLGVCHGNRNCPDNEKKTCDAHRGKWALTVNPLDPSTLQQIKYRLDGTISSDNAEIDHDLNVTLNLNCEPRSLKQNRKAAIGEVMRDIFSQKNEKLLRSRLEKILNAYNTLDSEGKYAAYVGIIRYFVEKWLRQR